MTTTIHQLPAHIIELVFQYVEKKTLKNCRLVCVLWYLLTTPYLFRSIRVSNTSDVLEFINFHENPTSDQLIQLGKYVKRVTTGRGRGMFDECMSSESFEKFVTYCPKVESVSICQATCRGYLYYSLLTVDDSIKWKLQRIDQTDEYQQHKWVYFYKYKNTIRAIRCLKDIQDFHALKEFPLLEDLIVPFSAVITNIQDFVFICNACPKLIELGLSVNIGGNERLMTGFPICPSLVTLYVNFHSLIAKTLVDYITGSLINLSNVTFCFQLIQLQEGFGDIYKQLNDFLFTSQKGKVCLRLKADTSRRDDNEQVYRMINECLNVIYSPSRLKPCRFMKWTVTESLVLNIGLYKSWDHITECQISISPCIFNKLIVSDAFANSHMSSLHKLCIEGESLGRTMPRTVCLFIEKASNLHELTLRWYRLQDIHNCVYESIQILRIEDAMLYKDFLKKLARSFPNLKELHLCKVSIYDSTNSFNHKLLDLGNLPLQILSLTTNRVFILVKTPKIELVCVETGNGLQYIKVCGNRAAKLITNEEGTELEKLLAAEHKYHIICAVPVRFELNSVHIQLVP